MCLSLLCAFEAAHTTRILPNKNVFFALSNQMSKTTITVVPKRSLGRKTSGGKIQHPDITQDMIAMYYEIPMTGMLFVVVVNFRGLAKINKYYFM